MFVCVSSSLSQKGHGSNLLVLVNKDKVCLCVCVSLCVSVAVCRRINAHCPSMVSTMEDMIIYGSY